MTDNVMNTNASTALATMPSQADIANWTEEKRQSFTKLFRDRSECALYICLRTAEILTEKAASKKYISQKHKEEILKKTNNASTSKRVTFDKAPTDPTGRGSYFPPSVGGRMCEELDTIASGRAERLLSELPPLRDAMQVIDPVIAKKIDRRKELLEEGQGIVEELEAISKPLSLAELSEEEPDLTLKQFLARVEGINDKRNELMGKLDKIGQTGTALDDTINTVLFKGLLGLSDAVVKVVLQHHERASAFGQVSRRVDEKVRFGDTEAAVTLLSHFEKDEVEVSETIRSEFSGVLDRIKGEVAKLKAKGKKTKEAET